MAATIAIVVFCKTPYQTPAKTRLGADVGQPAADFFYQQSVETTKHTLHQVQQNCADVSVWYAVAEERHRDCISWESDHTIWTGNGTLNQRLERMYTYFAKQCSGLIFVGSDAPHLAASVYIDAVEQVRMGVTDTVLGPCDDGGFYLFGMILGHGRNFSLLWNDVTLSSPETCRQLLRSLSTHGYTVHQLPFSFDVDTLADVYRLSREWVQPPGYVHELHVAIQSCLSLAEGSVHPKQYEDMLTVGVATPTARAGQSRPRPHKTM